MTAAPSPATGTADRVELPGDKVQRETLEAVRLADRVLDRPYADPDDDLAVLARQLLRTRERFAAALKPSSGAGAAGLTLDQIRGAYTRGMIDYWQFAEGSTSQDRAHEAGLQAIAERATTTIARQADDPERSRGDGWQPIEMAPRDGTRVLLFIPAYVRGEPVRLGAYAEGERWWRTTSGPCSDDALPTHWRPLPEPPARAQIARPSADQREGADEGGGRP